MQYCPQAAVQQGRYDVNKKAVSAEGMKQRCSPVPSLGLSSLSAISNEDPADLSAYPEIFCTALLSRTYLRNHTDTAILSQRGDNTLIMVIAATHNARNSKGSVLERILCHGFSCT